MTSKFILLAAAAVLFAGCGKEQSVLVKETSEGGGKNLNPSSGQVYEPATVWEDGYLVAFRPSFENLDTKLSISAGGVTAFAAGDAVLVSVDGAAGIEYQYDATEGVFKVAAGSTPVRVLGESIARIYYPFSCFSISEDNVIFSIPSYDSGSLAELGGMNPMAASAKNGDETIAMKNLATVIRIDLTCKSGEESYGGSVKLSSSNTALASGQEYTVDWNGDYPVFTANAGSEEADREVSISYDGGTLGKDTASSFYFLAPYSASGNIEGLTVTAVHNGNTYTRTRSDLPRSGIYNKVLWLAFRAGNFYAGTGTSEDPYQVKTVDDWCNISRLGKGGLDKHYKQVDNIDFSFDGRFGTDGKADISAYMIGDDTNKFTGSYNGNNKKLQNFSLSGTEEYTGLWRYGNNATFKNIFIDNASVTSTKHVGTIVGRHDGNNAELKDCKVTNSTVSSAGDYAGGLAGRAYGTVSGCEFGEEGSTSSVKGATSIGGIVGLNYAAVSGCENLGAAVTGASQTGGIIGNHAGEDEEVSDCVNRGGISCSGVRGGGIIGTVTKNATVSGCVNYGAVGGGTSNYKGGIIGSFYSQTTGKTLTITDAVNHGTVNGQSGIGGIIGGTDNAKAQADDVFIVIEGNTSNTNDVTGTNTNIGGIIGYPNKTKLTIGGTSCENSGKVTGVSNTGGIAGALEKPESSISNAKNYGEVKTTTGSYVGGIVGLINTSVINCEISDCTNNGSITCGMQYAGGIVGRIRATGCTISGCTNYQTVNCSQTSENNTWAGGILGFADSNMFTTIVSCTNSGAITSSKTYVGGIAGQLPAGLIDKCVNDGNVNGNAKNCNNVGGITGGISTATVKRCYSAKGITVQGGTRVGGIVGQLTGAGKVISCASYSYIRGKYTSDENTTVGIGFIVGVEQNESALVANCVALWDANDNTFPSQHTGKSKENKVTGGLVGAKVNGLLQNSYCKVPCNKIGFVYTTDGKGVVNGGSTATNGKPDFIGQIVAYNTAGDIKDCYYSGQPDYTGVRPIGTTKGGIQTNVTRISSGDNVQYDHASPIPVAVTTSTGNSFAANEFHLKDILDDGAKGITGYSCPEGEVLTWSDLSETDFTPIPTEILSMVKANLK